MNSQSSALLELKVCVCVGGNSVSKADLGLSSMVFTRLWS